MQFYNNIFSYFSILLQVGHRLRVSGRMGNDMVWASRRGDDGYIEANGHKALKDAMECDKVPHQLPNMKEHGQMDYRMAMDPRHMLMEVILHFS